MLKRLIKSKNSSLKEHIGLRYAIILLEAIGIATTMLNPLNIASIALA
jgi:hypothetical protein